MFYHERLHCYGRLKAVAGRLIRGSDGWPRGHAYLVDQLKRALCSGLLNLVEGNHRRSVKERKRFSPQLETRRFLMESDGISLTFRAERFKFIQ